MDPNGKDLKREYDLRFSDIEEYRTAVWKLLVKCYFQAAVGSPDKLLDLGSGWGEFINHIQAKEKFAMDLNPASKGKLVEGIHFIQQDCSQEWPWEDDSLDVVFSSNFFEHLNSKAALTRTLNQAFRCLRPGGRIFCLGPNIHYLNGRYWDFFDHYLPLTSNALAEGLQLSGFIVERTIPRFLPYTMVKKRRVPRFLIPLYLKFSFLWPLFGKQFLVVARK